MMNQKNKQERVIKIDNGQITLFYDELNSDVLNNQIKYGNPFWLGTDLNSPADRYSEYIKIRYDIDTDLVFKFQGGLLKSVSSIYNRDVDLYAVYDNQHNNLYYHYALMKNAESFIKSNLSSLSNELITTGSSLFVQNITSHLIDTILNSGISNYVKYPVQWEEPGKEPINYEFNNEKEKLFDKIIDSLQSFCELNEFAVNCLTNPDKAYSNMIHHATLDLNSPQITGYQLLQAYVSDIFSRSLTKAPENGYVEKQKNIFNAIKDLEAKTLTISLKYKDNILTFKYPADAIKALKYVPVGDKEIDNLLNIKYKGLLFYDEIGAFYNDIVEIKYKGNTLYSVDIPNSTRDLNYQKDNNLKIDRKFYKDKFLMPMLLYLKKRYAKDSVLAYSDLLELNYLVKNDKLGPDNNPTNSNSSLNKKNDEPEK